MIIFSSNYEESRAQAINHLTNFLALPVDVAISNIRSKSGSFTGSLSVLTLDAQCMAMLSYFRDHDIKMLQQWLWMVAKIDQALLKRQWHDNYFVGDLIWSMLSGDHELVEWLSKSEGYWREHSLKQRENPGTYPFFSYQACLAIRGEWELLAARASQVVKSPELLKKNSFLLCEHIFFLALAHGDVKGMENAISEIVSAKQRKRSFSTRNALVKGLMEPHAFLYTKIAQNHGFDLHVPSPWIPLELLNTDPSPCYTDFWGILPFL